ncbi:MAG: hypothetical protein QOD60_2025 [Solirubrobacterales bacterium]|jgi:hypothetical protein|nr:hypothetical protein [Solirubrobacterales bacterium]
MKSQRLAPLSGIAFVVLIIVGFVVISGSTPGFKDSATKIVDYYTSHKSREEAAAVVVGASIVFLAIFVACLYSRLKEPDSGNVWPTLALLGGTAAVAGFFGIIGVHAALIDGADKHIDPSAMVALNAIDNDNFFAFSLPIGVMLLGAAGATLKAGAFPRWLGWMALVLGIVTFTPAGFVGALLGLVWIIVVSILMSRAATA